MHSIILLSYAFVKRQFGGLGLTLGEDGSAGSSARPSHVRTQCVLPRTFRHAEPDGA
jgi:hypothetical protein